MAHHPRHDDDRAPTSATATSARLGLGFSSVAHSFSHLFTLLYATVVLSIEKDWGLGYDTLAFASVPLFLMFGLGAVPAGWLGDRWSAPGMIAVFFLGLGASSILTGLAQGLTGLTVGLTLIGLFASIYHPVGIAWLVRVATNRGRALGINGIFGSLGTAAAAVVAGYLADRFGWRAAFIVPGIVSLLVGLWFAVLIRLGRIADPAHDVAPGAPPSRGDVRRAFWVLSVTMLMSGLIFQATSVGLPKLFEERAGGLVDGTFGIGLLVSVVYLVSALTQYVGGELADRFPPRAVYLMAQLVQIPFILIAVSLSGSALVGVAVLMVSGNVVGQPAENSLLARYTPPAWRGRAFGAKFVLTLGVSSLGVSLVPLIHRLTGSLDGLLVALALFAGIGAAFCLLLPVEGRAAAAPAE
ncbi:MFS transporter [Zavarzinia aquatilis]|uniref:MFS transporter n=1 Tax=Zavarzinia aquatilis TaxID=2211142 RepID=A0A317EGK3_9PROT|nr:MFS transporter [Zavarzinia aquatilis]PWR25444.1 MFS transporter [Zavarzinia aquatilis]